jgi:hypothetical protein
MWSKSHLARWYGKVRGMESPPRDERRTVPRHLRDSEHDMSGSAPGSGRRAEDARNARLGLRVWIYAVVSAVMVGIAIWLGFTGR